METMNIFELATVGSALTVPAWQSQPTSLCLTAAFAAEPFAAAPFAKAPFSTAVIPTAGYAMATGPVLAAVGTPAGDTHVRDDRNDKQAAPPRGQYC